MIGANFEISRPKMHVPAKNPAGSVAGSLANGGRAGRETDISAVITGK